MKKLLILLLLVCSGLPAQAADVDKARCDRPGATATMQDFNPCTDVPVNSTWVLTDARPDAGSQAYTVRYLADGHFWMVDDLKYPTACNKTQFSGASSQGSLGANIPGFYGDCHNINDSSTPAGRGYLYDWMFVMQHADAYFGSSWDPGCTNNPSAKAACQGICPEGWHVPTGNSSTGEFTLLNNAVNGGSTCSDAGLKNTNTFNAVYGGYSNDTGLLYYQGSHAYYWSSTCYATNYAYHLYFYGTYVYPSSNDKKNDGYSLRCVRNY